MEQNFPNQVDDRLTLWIDELVRERRDRGDHGAGALPLNLDELQQSLQAWETLRASKRRRSRAA